MELARLAATRALWRSCSSAHFRKSAYLAGTASLNLNPTLASRLGFPAFTVHYRMLPSLFLWVIHACLFYFSVLRRIRTVVERFILAFPWENFGRTILGQRPRLGGRGGRPASVA